MLIWIAALFLMVWLIIRVPADRKSDDPMTILRTRFARGEISQDEFERAKAALLGDRQEPVR
jgi:uncharacterized membrane protein